MARFGEFRACRANFVPLWPPTTRAGRTLYRIQGGCGASRHNRTPSAAGMEGAGGTEGPDRGARERWQGQTAVPVGGGGAWPVFEPTRNTISTPGTAGVKGAGGSGGPGCGARGRRLCLAWLRDTSCRRCGGRRIAWPRCRWVAAGPGRASRSTTPSRRLACGDLAGGPPPTGTYSARNTSGATSNTTTRHRTSAQAYKKPTSGSDVGLWWS